MILTVDTTDKNYHDLVQFVDKVIIDGIQIKNCVYVDTVSGNYICYTDPLSVINGETLTESKRSNNIKITFKDLPQGFDSLSEP